MDLLWDFLYGKGSVGWSLYENIVEWKMACSTGGRRLYAQLTEYQPVQI